MNVKLKSPLLVTGISKLTALAPVSAASAKLARSIVFGGVHNAFTLILYMLLLGIASHKYDMFELEPIMLSRLYSHKRKRIVGYHGVLPLPPAYISHRVHFSAMGTRHSSHYILKK